MKPSRQFFVLCLFVLVGFIAFSNILNSYFLSDDFAQIGRVLAGDLSVVWGKGHGGFFRPLFIFSYLIDTKTWGAPPLGFHLTNIVFHSLNAFLSFKLTLRMIEGLTLTTETKKAISIGAGALFLLHPSHTEAVSWISGRADLIATFFCLTSLLWYVAYARSKRGSQIALSLACFGLALLAKESAICLPSLVAVTGVFMGQAGKEWKTRRKFLAVIALYVSLLLIFVAVRSVFIGSLVGGYGADQHLDFSPGWLQARLLQASLRSILPALPSQWSRFLLKPLQSWIFGIIALVFSAIVAILVISRRKRYRQLERGEQNRYLLTLLSLFLLSLLPVINLRLSLYDTQGERWVYLPSVFICLALSYLPAIIIRNQPGWLLIIICLLGFYSAKLYQTNQRWREAAKLSRNILDDLTKSATHSRLLIINAPDNLNGVYVYRNGLSEAMVHFQNQMPIKQVEIIALQNLQSTADEVNVIADGDRLTINSVNETDTFWRATPSECLEVLSQSAHSLDLRRRPCSPNADLFFFSKGAMIKLADR